MEAGIGEMYASIERKYASIEEKYAEISVKAVFCVLWHSGINGINAKLGGVLEV